MGKIKFIFSSLIDVIVYFYYKIYFIVKRNKESNIWLISERGIDARDNGYWFYKYMVEKHPEIPVKYVIARDSADYSKINEKDVVEYRSKEHYYYFMYSKYLISAEIMGYSPNEQLYYRLNKYGLLNIKGKKIFLQHGITCNYNTYMLPQHTKLDLFICGAMPEQRYMVEKYGYDEDKALLTGFSRFDNLIDEKSKILLIMPTWRKWLKYENTIIESEYYLNYMKLLNDKEICELAKSKGYKIIFYPHIILQKFANEFKSKYKNVVIAKFDEYDVQELMKKSELLITDYSSVSFDFAYMNKNVIYFQFDKKRYREEQYSEGFYSYEDNGFGPVCYEFNELKQNILKYLNNNNCFHPYSDRVFSFFTKIDTDNSKRIYEAIMKLK